jgi:hypothetical protein
MSRTPDLKRYAIWRECVRRQADRGLTIVQFCARERLSVATFQSWKRRLRIIDLANHRVNAIHHSQRPLLGGEALEFLDWIVGELNTTIPRSWGTTFSYRWLESPNGPWMTWWLLELYGTQRYVCSTLPV